MGLFAADTGLTLQPVHPPLGLNMNYVNHPVVTLVLKEKVFSWSGVSDTPPMYGWAAKADVRTTSPSPTQRDGRLSSAAAR